MKSLRKFLLILVPIPALLALGGCFGGGGSRCEDAERYANSDSIAPLRIPDDLTVPDESETLLIPGNSGFGARDEAPVQGCLESPPSFYGTGNDNKTPSA